LARFRSELSLFEGPAGTLRVVPERQPVAGMRRGSQGKRDRDSRVIDASISLSVYVTAYGTVLRLASYFCNS
jgi:hypothetical protein